MAKCKECKKVEANSYFEMKPVCSTCFYSLKRKPKPTINCHNMRRLENMN